MQPSTDKVAAPTAHNMRARPLFDGELGVKNRNMKIWDPDLSTFPEDED